jgi:hypothetical protein
MGRNDFLKYIRNTESFIVEPVILAATMLKNITKSINAGNFSFDFMFIKFIIYLFLKLK